MKKIKIIAVAILFLTACSKDANDVNLGSTSQSDLAAGSMQKTSVARPFKITFTTTVDPDPSIPPTPCTGDLPGLANAGLFIQGNATHLGQLQSTSRLQDVTCNLSFTTALLTTSIAGQLVAANGDKVFFTGNDEINVLNLLLGHPELPGTITGVWTITGGTGRFVNATGSFTINGPVDFTTSSFSGEGVGTIVY
jgi:hypothetical protein